MRSKVTLEEVNEIQNGGKLRIQVNWKLKIIKLVTQCKGKKIMDSKWKSDKRRERERERNRVKYG